MDVVEPLLSLSDLTSAPDGDEEESFSSLLSMTRDRDGAVDDDLRRVKREGLPPFVRVRGCSRGVRIVPFPSRVRKIDKYRVSCPEIDCRRSNKRQQPMRDAGQPGMAVRPSAIVESNDDTKKPYVMRLKPAPPKPPRHVFQRADTKNWPADLRRIRESLASATTEGDHVTILERQLKPMIDDWCRQFQMGHVKTSSITAMPPHQLDAFMRDWSLFENMVIIVTY